MAAPDPSASVLAWSWIIEALATSPSVDLATLHGLIGSVPNLSDNLGKEAREMVALRCLEGFYDPDKRFEGDDSSSFHKKGFEFDSCESFELVLQRVMEQTSVTSLGKGGFNELANLRKGASNELVREVRAFVERRKTGLRKCALEQMRDRLKQKGGSSLATNMKQVNGPEVLNTDADKRNKLLEDKSVSETPVCGKRDRSCLQTEMHVGLIDVESDELPPRKELRQGGDGAIASTEQDLAPVDDVELSEDASRRNVPHTEGEVPQNEQELQMEGREIRTLCGANEEPVKLTSPQTCQLSEDESRRNVPRTEGEVPEAAQEVQIEGRESWILSNANEEPVKPTCPQTCQLSDVCLMCKEGGKLLTCANSCRMVVHERCLGFSARLDSKGDFICPVCAHSQALAKYAETKKNLLLAREELSLFVGSNPVPWQLDRSKVLLPENEHHQRQGTDVDKSVQLTSAQTTSKDEEPVGVAAIPSEVVPSKQKGAYPVDGASKGKQQEDHLAPGNADSAPTCSSKEGEGEDVSVEKVHHGKGQRKMQIEDFNDAGLHGSNPKKQRHGLSKNAETMEAKNFKNKLSRNCSRPQAEQKLADQMVDALSASLGDHDGASEDKICKDTTSKHPLRHQIKQKPADLKDAYSASHNDSDGTSGEENCRATSKYSLRSPGKRIPICDAIPTTPLERRIRLNWTAEEVEMLKEGVKRFASHDMKAVPWRSILDFGCSVFLKGRTPVDLKDKWRNLVRSAQTLS